MNGDGLVLVINPNSNPAVTDGMSRALEPLRAQSGPVIECVTLTGGPFGIETQAHVEEVTLPLRDVVREREDADAYVIGCFSDPGLAVCREATRKPVLGIQECAIFAALTRGDRFGVVALSLDSIRRQNRALRQLGVAGRCAGARPLGLSVAEAEGRVAYPKVLEAAQALVERDGADVLVLGCAGMTAHRSPLTRDLGVPVVDPTQAAAAQAVGLVLLDRAG